jgi:hypothetical protein
VGCPLGWTMQTAYCLTTRITTRLAAELRGWRPLGCAQIAVSFARRLLEHCVKIAPAKAADLSASHVEDRSPAHALTISGRNTSINAILFITNHLRLIMRLMYSQSRGLTYHSDILTA